MAFPCYRLWKVEDEWRTVSGGAPAGLLYTCRERNSLTRPDAHVPLCPVCQIADTPENASVDETGHEAQR